MAQDKIKFIRVRGRVVPIKSKSVNSQKAQLLRKTAAYDKKIATQGKAYSKMLFGASIGLAGLGILNRSIRGVALSSAAATGLGSFINASFASGRRMSSKDRYKYANDIEKGKKIKRGQGIGGASDRAFSDAQYLSKLPNKTFLKLVKKK